MLELFAASAALASRAILQAADASLLAVSEEEVRESLPRHPLRARWVQALMAQPEPTATSLRASMSGLLAFAAVACAIWVGDLMSGAGLAPSSSRSTLQLLAGLFAGGVALLLDLAPRSLAAASPLRWALALAGPARFICVVLGPFVRLLLRVFDGLLLPQGATARYSPPPPPMEAIERILTEEAASGGTGSPSAELVHGLFQFAERTAEEVMVPRTRVVAIPLDTRPQAVVDLLAEQGHTRMPVFEGDLDHIRGVLHSKDVIPLLAHPELIVLQDLIRPAVFVPWTKPVGELLREMQAKRCHIVMVVDEYGGFSGIVCLEDILEEIVGEIQDEHDVEPAQAISLGPDGTATLPAETRIDEVNRRFAAELPSDDDYDTLSGLLNSCAGAIPRAGDRFFVGGLELTVLERDERRVRSVRVGRPRLAAAEAERGAKSGLVGT